MTCIDAHIELAPLVCAEVCVYPGAGLRASLQPCTSAVSLGVVAALHGASLRMVRDDMRVRLVPSAYAVSSSSYLSVSNATRMYNNTDNTTYATIKNTYASTSSRYLYLRGFNFGSIPAGANIKSFVVKIKGNEGGLATSTSYAPRLANGTSALSGTTASQNFGTSVKTITIPTGALTWQQITNYGSNFTIMVYVRRNARNTTGYAYIYGAEIEVTYEI